jgi:RRXRR protein/HNH endonuclease
MKSVAVLDTTRKPLAPTTLRRAAMLLKRGRAAVFCRAPFAIILMREVSDIQTPDLNLKIDPGSKTSGAAIVDQETGEVVFAVNLHHRGKTIKKSLDSRRAQRRNRRHRKTRYRQPRFDNRRRPEGWLPPSLQSRAENLVTITRRLSRFYPIKRLTMELVKFDMQLMENAEIKGVEYQQGELAGFEQREYLLQKFGRQCVYVREGSTCNEVLNVDHLQPRARGGTDRISNLVIACRKHNEEKGEMSVEDYCARHGLDGSKIVAQAKQPLKDAAAVNATRWALFSRLKSVELPVEIGSGGLTKFNRLKRDLPKEHWIDAACVGKSTPERLEIAGVRPLEIKASGHGSRQMCLPDKYGFPRTSAKTKRVVHGFRTGDRVKAVVPEGKKKGVYVGKVAVRSSGSFNITTREGTIQGISYKHCQLLQRADGYSINS